MQLAPEVAGVGEACRILNAQPVKFALMRLLPELNCRGASWLPERTGELFRMGRDVKY